MKLTQTMLDLATMPLSLSLPNMPTHVAQWVAREQRRAEQGKWVRVSVVATIRKLHKIYGGNDGD
ncbi:MAG: hypothetical protein EBR82_53420 [Caulobacteraceae bacterium]|nr:hypothetical protein [Caulobacteraceae bacterium]